MCLRVNENSCTLRALAYTAALKFEANVVVTDAEEWLPDLNELRAKADYAAAISWRWYPEETSLDDALANAVIVTARKPHRCTRVSQSSHHHRCERTHASTMVEMEAHLTFIVRYAMIVL